MEKGNAEKVMEKVSYYGRRITRRRDDRLGGGGGAARRKSITAQAGRAGAWGDARERNAARAHVLPGVGQEALVKVPEHDLQRQDIKSFFSALGESLQRLLFGQKHLYLYLQLLKLNYSTSYHLSLCLVP